MNRIDLEGRVVVITGGARGIGYAVAQRALRSGASVSLWDRDNERLARSKHELGELVGEHGKVSAVTVDQTKEAEIDAAVSKTLAAHGAIDVLINCAGITGGNGTTWELDPNVWRQVIDVNLIGPYLVCRAVVPQMLKQGYGRIVNIASVAAKEGNPNASHYSASKAGLIGLTKSLGKELATKNILVNAVTPAAAKTEIFDSMSQQHIDYMLSKIPMNRFLLPEEAASLILWLSSEDCAFSTGAVFDLSGGRATY
ncbi:SDR family NAD(P)-dependent oxidoreductase [Paraburkholderia diazotrophica]|uniref:3-oxoacyl-[acyl-carrier protein] reductase n=1 Tax=Paraburkholderia diazotrophica TaxID=667676 RepID=A0A1H6VGL1_9BURK|nr:SDR family NAD(P)-dependent oxidoreductase [Paraburkholderia diazotrophica]SEJ03708.1 3-oxoacyl-[acyl-carrier protein] reductase [Paraburkholderia diazotrophica]